MSTSFLVAILVAVGLVGVTTAIGAIGVTSFVFTSGPLPFRFVITALICLTVFFEIVMVVSRSLGIFDEGTQVITALMLAFAAFGILVATYFGIQSSSDSADRRQVAIEKPTNTANWALSQLDPEVGRRIVRDKNRATLKNLADLYAQGILTEEEFANAKSRLMN